MVQKYGRATGATRHHPDGHSTTTEDCDSRSSNKLRRSKEAKPKRELSSRQEQRSRSEAKVASSRSRQLHASRLAKISGNAAICAVDDKIHGAAVGKFQRRFSFYFDRLNLFATKFDRTRSFSVDDNFDIDLIQRFDQNLIRLSGQNRRGRR